MKWEYKFEVHRSANGDQHEDSVAAKLNELGQLGWELISHRRTTSMESSCLLKKPIVETEE